MKYESLSKFTLLVALALTLVLAGCGGSNHNLAITPGNWSMAAASSNPVTGTFYIGGNLAQNGSNLSGTMYVIGSTCISPSQQQSFSGTADNKQVTLTSSPDPAGEVITIVASGTGSALNGSYSVTGGSCANGDHGTVNANAVPAISGTWAGAVNDSNDPSASLSIALTQAPTASADGTFALSGTLTFQNSLCEASGTISSGSMFGPTISFTAITGAGDTIYYNGGMLDSTTNPQNFSIGTYDVSGGACDGDESVPNFTKQ